MTLSSPGEAHQVFAPPLLRPSNPYNKMQITTVDKVLQPLPSLLTTRGVNNRYMRAPGPSYCGFTSTLLLERIPVRQLPVNILHFQRNKARILASSKPTILWSRFDYVYYGRTISRWMGHALLYAGLFNWYIFFFLFFLLVHQRGKVLWKSIYPISVWTVTFFLLAWGEVIWMGHLRHKKRAAVRPSHPGWCGHTEGQDTTRSCVGERSCCCCSFQVLDYIIKKRRSSFTRKRIFVVDDTRSCSHCCGPLSPAMPGVRKDTFHSCTISLLCVQQFLQWDILFLILHRE